MIKTENCPHILIAGLTQYGKSWLAREIAKEYKKRGAEIIVLDPVSDAEWHGIGAKAVVDNPADFMTLVKANEQALAIIDEAPSALNKKAEWDYFGMRGRHHGKRLMVITQRVQGVTRNLRDQLTERFLFRVDFQDKEELLKRHGAKLANIDQLPQGAFYHIDKLNQVHKRATFYPEK